VNLITSIIVGNKTRLAVQFLPSATLLDLGIYPDLIKKVADAVMRQGQTIMAVTQLFDLVGGSR
jgi:hypothetical protein